MAVKDGKEALSRYTHEIGNIGMSIFHGPSATLVSVFDNTNSKSRGFNASGYTVACSRRLIAPSFRRWTVHDQEMGNGELQEKEGGGSKSLFDMYHIARSRRGRRGLVEQSGVPPFFF